MNLGELMLALREQGDRVTDWFGIDTNVDSVSELIGSNETGKFSIELK